MLRLKDMKNGVCYSFRFQGHPCLATIAAITPGTIHCNYVTGMSLNYDKATNPETIIKRNINLRDYERDIDFIMQASGAECARYNQIIQNRMKITQTTLGDILKAKKQTIEPVVYETEKPTIPGVKVVGTIAPQSLAASAAQPSSPVSCDTSHVHSASAAQPHPSVPGDVSSVPPSIASTPATPTIAASLNYPSQYHFKDMEYLKFTHNGRCGCAIGMVDNFHRMVGYYVAMNLFGSVGNVTHLGDDLPNEKIKGGEWPDGIHLQPAEFSETYLCDMLMADYKEDIDKYHAKVKFDMEEEARIFLERIEAEKRKADELRLAAIAQSEAKRPSEDELSHLGYVRGTECQTDRWPQLPSAAKMSKACKCRWILHSILESMIDMNVKKIDVVKTYIMSDNYIKEMLSRYKQYSEQYKSFSDFRRSGGGTLVWTQNNELHTLLYLVSNDPGSTLYFALIINDELQLAYSIKYRGVVEQPVINSSYLAPYSKNKVDGLIKMIFCHVAMEKDVDNIILQQCEAGNADEYFEACSTDKPYDIEIRNTSWFTTFFVNKQIFVDSYLSHRWCGSGKDRHLEVRRVRPYVKSGYTKPAGVTIK